MAGQVVQFKPKTAKQSNYPTAPSIKTRSTASTKPKLDTTPDKAAANKNKSLFQKRLNKLRKQFDVSKDSAYSEKTALMTYQAMLDMVQSLIPIAEENYRQYRYDRAAYALNTYLNQAREIINDMRAIHDFSEVGLRIVNLIGHHITLMTQHHIQDCFLLEKELFLIVSKQNRPILKQLIKKHMNTHGKYLAESFKSLREQIFKTFSYNELPTASRKVKSVSNIK